jgi:hypothetical protein
MATTTNFGWETPDDTDLVKDGALAMRTLGNSIDTSFVDLKGGTTGQILSKASNTDLDYTWINNDQGDITGVTAGTGISGGGTSGTVTITNDMATTITAAGDIVVGTGNGTYDNLPIGTTGQVLTADTTVSPYKVKWAAATTPAFVGCQLWNSTTQSLSNDTYTVMTFDSELIDTDNFHSTTSNTGRITIPSGKDGKYLFIGSVNFASGTGPIAATLYKNNAELTSTGTSVMFNASYSTSAIYGAVAHIIISAVAGDYFELRGYQNSGGTRSTRDNHGFGCVYLGA